MSKVKVVATGEQLSALDLVINAGLGAIEEQGVILTQGEDGKFKELKAETLEEQIKSLFENIEFEIEEKEVK